MEIDGHPAEPFAEAAAVLEAAVEDGAFPGAAFGVLDRGRVAALGGVGRFTFVPESAPVSAETRFDLASLTKVAATAAMAMLLWQRGQMDLDALLGDLLPGFIIGSADARERRRVTLRMLLAHSSGMPAHVPFYETCRGPEVLRAAMRAPLAYAPGAEARYSDPGFMLLGKALEVLAGERIDRFCRREIFAPLGMERTSFGAAVEERGSIPPTEDDGVFRGRVVQGEVHDENCWAMGGVCGHAGLFAPAGDLLRFAKAMLAPLRGEQGLFLPEAVRLFTRRAEIVPGSSRALGWDTPSAPSSSGTHFNPASFGHLGYTGTSLWIDPERDRAVVLLTNRTFPTRENRKIQEVRPRFHDAAMHVLEIGTDTRAGVQEQHAHRV